jgi:hypothetical protein
MIRVAAAIGASRRNRIVVSNIAPSALYVK